MTTAVSKQASQYGLVCVTASDECRYRTITRTRYLSLTAAARRAALRELYADNVARLAKTIEFCAHHDIRLYRMMSNLFPMSDESLGRAVLRELKPMLRRIGKSATETGTRNVNHPEQFVVLSSDSPAVVKTAIIILKKEAMAMDLLGLPKTPWASLIIHCGKAGRSDALVKTIAKLPKNIRGRLCLENDEYSYSAAEVLDVCRRANVPMVFDNLHHVIREGIDSYEHPSVTAAVHAARNTWPDPAWQLVHLSNGRDSFADRHHSELITDVPSAYHDVPWIEIEAKGKERAIERLRKVL